MELEVQDREVAAGPYSADILDRDTSTDALVVIENQLEKTNHDHFGKALTYAAVLGASTVVWIARTFTDEHRKAVEWLNELTGDGLLVSGVEVQVWQIGDSLPAPRFEVVCGPNEAVRKAQVAREADELPETRQLRGRFWEDVRASLVSTGRFSSLGAARPRGWFNIALGRAGLHLSMVARTFAKRVGVRVYLVGRVADQALRQLDPLRAEIETQIGASLEWNPHPEKKDKVITLWRPGDIADEKQRPELIQWLTEYTVKFHQAFAPRVANLDLSPVGVTEDREAE